MTNESAFPNMTHEELHFSLNKYNNYHGQADETANNTTLGGCANLTNTTLIPTNQ